MNLAWGEGDFTMRYTLNQEYLIHKLAKEKVNELQTLLYGKDVLSDRQRENARKELKQYQELLYQNRLNRQMEMR